MGCISSQQCLYNRAEQDFFDTMDYLETPFPCNGNWDKKWWWWLQNNKLDGKTLFYNLGGEDMEKIAKKTWTCILKCRILTLIKLDKYKGYGNENLTEQQLLDNYQKLLDVVEEHFDGERKEKILKMYDFFKERIMVWHLYGKPNYHYCFVGGYVEYVLHIVQTVKN